jgi:hypothetical protein
VLAFSLTMGQTSASASGRLLGLGDDRSAIGRCSTTMTGSNDAVINVPSGQTFCLRRLTQTGAVNVAPGGALEVRGSNITGAITLDTPRAFTFCTTTIIGAISSTKAAHFVLIGDGGDTGLLGLLDPTCGSSQINGAVTLTGNLGGVEVGGNTINAALNVSGNVAPNGGTEDAATEIEGNAVVGLTTCADNNPAPVNGGQMNTFTGGVNGQCAGL